MKLLNSLRVRSLISGIIVVILLFVVTHYARKELLKALDNSVEISTEYESYRVALLAVKQPMYALESKIYLYTLILSPTKKKQAEQYLNEVSFQANNLLKHRLTTKTPSLLKDIKKFITVYGELRSQLEIIINLGHADRYKTINQIMERLSPHHEKFINEVTSAINILEFQFDDDDDKLKNVQNIYKLLQFRWIQHVSETRMLITAKSGMMGENTSFFKQVSSNMENYEAGINQLLSKLDRMVAKRLLEHEQAMHINNIRDITLSRFMVVDELLALPFSHQIREDIPVIRFQLNSLFEQTFNGLTIMDRRLESLIRKNLQANRVTIENISNLLIAFFIFILVILFSLFLVFEFWLRKPLLNLTKAIKAEGEHSHLTGTLEFQGIIEIDALVASFIKMQEQIHQREKNIQNTKLELENNNVLLVKKNDLIQTSLIQLIETQEQLVESEKMASLGNLVAGVAHEVNTPIGVCITANSSLQYNLDELQILIDSNKVSKRHLLEFTKDASESLNIISNNLVRAADLVKSFKQVAVDQSSDEVRNFNFKEYIDEILLNLRPKLKRTQHKVMVECDNDIMVNSYPGAFSQIITNFIMNTLIHAYDKGVWGKISLIIKKHDDGQLLIEYRDDGKGLNEEQQTKIFEPFYTTRRGEGGSGLGMNISYNLVTQQLKGKIELSSNSGKGIVFKIKCPIDIATK